jgi:mRNA-degrading endonuclease HigB of HigAB toxin-antitoxin module
MFLLGALKEFWERHPDAESALRAWYRNKKSQLERAAGYQGSV